jgi:hypothetical protein
VFACERLVFDGPRETVEPAPDFHRVRHTFAVDGADFLYDARAEINCFTAENAETAEKKIINNQW